MTTRHDAARTRAPAVRAAGSGPGQRRLNGVQTSGREYRNLSEAEYANDRTNSIAIPMGDGARLRADTFLPTEGESATTVSVGGTVHHDDDTLSAPALVSFSCYPRQVQDLGAPFGFAEEPFGRLWQEGAVEHPTHDAWWDARDVRSALDQIEIPVYLGCQWDNVPMHLPSTFPVWRGLTHNPHVRMTLIDKDALSWPWESMHEEALAWYDRWLKGRDTGITDGPPIRYVIPGTDQWRTAEQWPPPEATLAPYALRADGALSTDEGDPGSRSYLYLAAETGRPRNANPPTPPDRLTWQTDAMTQPMDIVGDIELELDAEITALDTAWIVVLYDLEPDATATPISAGWLRATMRTVDEAASRPGVPVIPCREPATVPLGEVVHYRIPIVPNARRIPVGHRLQLVLTSSDDGEDGPTVLGFTHTSIAESSRNTVHSSSRLLLPALPSETSADNAEKA